MFNLFFKLYNIKKKHHTEMMQLIEHYSRRVLNLEKKIQDDQNHYIRKINAYRDLIIENGLELPEVKEDV